VPDSKIRQIVDAIVVEVAKVSPIGANGTKLEHWAEVSNFPAAFTYFAGETKALRPTQSVEAAATVGVYCVVTGKDDPSGQDDPVRAFLELYRQIVLNVEDDPALGGLVQLAMVTEALPMVTAETISKGVFVADVLISVTYRHARGTP